MMRTAGLMTGFCIALSMASVAQQPTTLRITDGPRVEGASSNSAQIAWTTNASAGSMLLYGTDRTGVLSTVSQGWPANQIQPNGATPGMAEIPWGGTTHRIQLTNLQPQTTYYFAVRSTAGQNTLVGNATSNVSSFTTGGNGQAQGRETRNQYGGYQNQGRNSSAYRQGATDGQRDREGNQARNYRGQYDNDNDRADYQSGYDQSYSNRNGYGNGQQGYSRDQNEGRGDDNRNQAYENNGGSYDRGHANGQYGNSQNNPAYQNGFRDGMSDGRNDFQARRNGSPTSQANYRNATAGYNRSWGSQDQYKDMYREGYMRGYQRGYNGQDSYEPR